MYLLGSLWVACALLGLPLLASAQTENPPAPLAPESPPAPLAPESPPAPLAPESPPTPSAPEEVDHSTAQRLLAEGVRALAAGDLAGAYDRFSRASHDESDPASAAAAEFLANEVATLVSERRLQAAAEARTRATAGRSTGRSTGSARPFFLLTTTVLGVAGGWTVPFALGIDPDAGNTRAFFGLYMLSAASAFVVPYFLTRGDPPTWGQANLAFYGATRGLEYGLLVSNLLLGADGGNLDDDDPQAFSTSILLGSVGSLVGGTWWAGAAEMTPGEARTLAVVADYGLLAGFAAGYGFDLDRPTLSNNERARAMSALGLVGVIGGITSGRLLARSRDNTWGDGEVLRTSALMGVLLGGTAAALFDMERERTILPTLALGGGLGLVGGDFLVRDTDFSVGQSILVELAFVAGGLAAMGTTYLITESEEPAAYLSAASLGAAIGGGLAYWGFRGAPNEEVRRQGGPLVAALPQFHPSSGQIGLTLVGAF